MNNIESSFAKRLTADRNNDQGEAIHADYPLEKIIIRKAKPKPNTKHKGQRQTQTRDRDELLCPNNECQQNKARTEAVVSPGNVTPDEGKQYQQTKPQQSENLYIKPKNWISYLPLLETPIHKHVQVNNSDSVFQNDQIEPQSSKSPTKPPLNKYTSSGKPSIDKKRRKVNKENILSFGNKRSYINHQFHSRNHYPPFRKHRRDRYLNYLPSYQDLTKDWLNYLHLVHQPDHYLRICYLDFSKAFEHIDHNVLVKKLIDLGVRGSLIAWLCSFLSDRRQAVKLNSLIWTGNFAVLAFHRGQNFDRLFAITINNLAVKFPLIADHWKFVDDVTLSEVVKTESISVLQTNLDTISAWAKDNNMNINPKKCKEMVVCPLKHTPDLAPLLLNEVPLDKVVSHKVLGMTIMDNLKWIKTPTK
ncbi:Hypothetical predicted protein [Paramuricea clavata]|uniref:Reverse transcriptase domain-containing protein n=1 Tax=Paramuricea clavata TaxID=317549 RepID=A0A7D9DEA8_PARCT|nr:Hypothetical predicted protein [Paramuricea clavata]